MFLKKLLFSMDYFSNLSEETIEELHYMLVQEFFEQGTEVFTAGDHCKSIFFIVDGEVDLFVPTADGEELLLDTLYPGCSIGAYSILKREPFPFTARARSNLTVLLLEYRALNEARDYLEELECAIWDASEFLLTHGVPLCDYKMCRPKELVMKDGRPVHFSEAPLHRLRNAVRRVILLNKKEMK